MAGNLPAGSLLVNLEEDSGAAHIHEQGRRGVRELFSVLGVEEDDGAYVLIIGIIFMGIMVIGCCYCKVYDPTKAWCAKKYKRYCTRRPKAPKQPPPRTPPAEERNHWYLNKTLRINEQDRNELGPIGEGQGLKGGWYGAKNGGFNV